jgi:hypothetical protein
MLLSHPHDDELDSYHIDHLQLMQAQAQEPCYRIGADYLSSTSATITAEDRRALCSWSYEIIKSLSNINSEVACIGMSYLDRFMATSSPRAKAALTTRHEYQLATVACTVIAIKNRGGIKHLGSDFVSDIVCHGLYTSDEIDGMEMEVLQALSWRLNGPSPHELIDALVGLLPTSSCEDGSEDNNESSSILLSKYSKMQVDAAVLEYDLALQSSQALAYSAILTSLRTSSDLTDHFCPMDLINWVSKIDSIMAGSRMDQIFLKGLEDVIEITYLGQYFDDNMEDDTEDNTEDDDKNKYKDNNTKDDDEVQSSRSDKVKVGRPLRMRRVSSMSWSAGDFDALSTASTMLYE